MGCTRASWMLALVIGLVCSCSARAEYLGVLLSGDNLTGGIGPGGDADRYHVNLEVGQLLLLGIGWQSGPTFGPFVQLLDSNGVQLANASGSCQPRPNAGWLVWTATTAGTYKVRVTDGLPPQAGGTYSLSVVKLPGRLNGPGDARDQDSRPLPHLDPEVPVTLQASRFDLADIDVFTYKADRPGSLEIWMRNTTGDVWPQVSWVDPSGKLSATQFAPGPTQAVTYGNHPTAGTYAVVCYAYCGFGTGGYEIEVTEIPVGPYVTETDPAQDGVVYPNAAVTLTFSEAMRKGSVETNLQFRRLAGTADAASAAAVPFTTRWPRSDEVVVAPTVPLAVNARYRVAVPAGVRSLGGAKTSSAFHLDFRTQSLIEVTVPGDGETAVPRRASVFVRLREGVDLASARTRLRLRDSQGATVPGQVQERPNRVLELDPDPPLEAAATYTAILQKGITLDNASTTTWAESFSFTTRDGPVVVDWSPRGNKVPLGSKVVVTFDRSMVAYQVKQCFHLAPATLPLAGVFRWSADKTQLTFIPAEPLRSDTLYHVTIDAEARDSEGGIEMGEEFQWSFWTVAAPPGPSALALTGAATRIPLDAAEVRVSLSQAASVHATICNLAGRVVAALRPRDLPAGTSTLLWNGLSSTGTAAPPGRYLVIVEARAAGGASARCIVPLQR